VSFAPALRGGAPQRVARAQSVPVPPPVGGWNARDPLSAMPPSDAIVLDNYVPIDGGIESRPGSVENTTGISGLYVESLMEYDKPGSSAKLFAAATTAIWDASSAGAASSSLTGLTNGRWQHTMMSNAGSHYLLCVNGADGLRYYDGTGWSTAALTGTITAALCIGIQTHQNRVWLIEENSLDIYYLGTGAVTGAATRILLSTQFKLGGKLLAMGTWTRDGGSGMDDLAAFVSSRGEVLIYQGTDPSAAATWTKVGLFKIPEPIGRRCLIKLGGDIAILTSQGLIPMSEVLAKSDAAQRFAAITDKISGAFAQAYQTYGTLNGWQVIEFPSKGLLIINVPTEERVSAVQYVMNTKTGAWARWTGLNADVWGLKGADMYFGKNNGRTSRFGHVESDDGAAINPFLVQAYNAFGNPMRKRFTRFRPQFHGPETYRPLVDLLFEYDPDIPTYSPPTAVSSGTPWGSPWGSPWAGAAGVSTFGWQAIHGTGVAAALVISASTKSTMQYNGGLVAYETGGIY
jgi:hypothetical protein